MLNRLVSCSSVVAERTNCRHKSKLYHHLHLKILLVILIIKLMRGGGVGGWGGAGEYLPNCCWKPGATVIILWWSLFSHRMLHTSTAVGTPGFPFFFFLRCTWTGVSLSTCTWTGDLRPSVVIISGPVKNCPRVKLRNSNGYIIIESGVSKCFAVAVSKWKSRRLWQSWTCLLWADCYDQNNQQHGIK